MKHAFRFIFGAALGMLLGYALTLFVRPGRNGHSTRRPARPHENHRDEAS